MIDIADLRKSYERTRALGGFSARVETGEIFGLVGPNGAGKTTLISILATLVRPDGGRAAIADHDVTGDPRAVRRLVGYLPDVPGVYQEMRVVEFLEFFADAFRLRGPRRRAAVEGALRQAGLLDRRGDFVEQLSLGMKQRLLLAKTLLHTPKVLLLDEPATGLDPLARIELRELLKRLKSDGTTVLISSHILSDLEDICDRVALIESGKNAVDPEGRSVLAVSGQRADQLTCEIEVLGNLGAAVEAAGSWPGARVLEQAGQRLLVEVAGGGERAAALLSHLVGAGVRVVRFDPRGAPLEQRYRRAFGGDRR